MRGVQLGYYVDGIPLSEIRKKEFIDHEVVRSNYELVDLILELKNNQCRIVPNHHFILPLGNNLMEISSKRFLKRFDSCELRVPDTKKICIEIKLDPQKKIKDSIEDRIKSQLKDTSCRGLGWWGISARVHRIYPLIEVYRGQRIFTSDSLKLEVYGDSIVGTVPSMSPKKEGIEHKFRVTSLPIESKKEYIYAAWVDMYSTESIAGSIYESESQRFRTKEFRFKYGSIASVISRFFNINVKNVSINNLERMLLYSFVIPNKTLIELCYKMSNNVLVERIEKYGNFGERTRYRKLNLAEKENIIWYAIHNSSFDKMLLTGNDLKEVKEALNYSVAHTKEKD